MTSWIRKASAGYAADSSKNYKREVLYPRGGDTRLSDYFELKPNQTLLRFYQVLPDYNISDKEMPSGSEMLSFDPANPQTLRVWDVVVGKHPVDKRISRFYESKEKENIPIKFAIREQGDKISLLERRNKIVGDAVFTLDYKEVYNVNGADIPLLRAELAPAASNPDKNLILHGQVPFTGTTDPIPAVLAANHIQPIHPTEQQLRDAGSKRVTCMAYDCPLCRHLPYLKAKLEKLEQANRIPKDERRFRVGSVVSNSLFLEDEKTRNHIIPIEFPPELDNPSSNSEEFCNCDYCTTGKK